jgi:proteic killer suppression protein
MIKTFAHKGIEAFFKKGTRAGIQAAHAARLARQLAHLNQAQLPRDMNLPGWKLHALSGGLDKHWAVTVSGNWRLTFRFDDGDAILVDYQDYH